MHRGKTAQQSVRRVLLFLAFPLALAGQRGLSGEDWPTCRHDSARTGITAESLRPPLKVSWVHRSRQAPRPAWPGPARWDGWHKLQDLEDRMVFDRVFHVAAAGDAVYYGSSVDDGIHCLDAATGEVRWSHFTEGPVRLAPTVAAGRVLAGSDDGHVYCLRRGDGKILWKHRPGPRERRVAGNGRVISLWPVRTGVVVLDGKAYCAAGVFPSEKVYLTALDAASGEALWKTTLTDLPAQGYLLASPGRLYVTTGRDRPVVFDRATGKRLHQVDAGGGGTFALLTGDTLLYGPGKTGELSLHGANRKDQLASFDGNHMIVTPEMSYLHTDTELAALDRPAYVKLYGERRTHARKKDELSEKLEKLGRKATDAQRKEMGESIRHHAVEIQRLSREMKGCFRWRIACDDSLALILAGETLFAGGDGRVAAFDTASGREIWHAAVDGNAHGLAVAGGRLLVSTDAGSIHCFTSGGSGTVPGSPTAARVDPASPSEPPSAPSPAAWIHGPFAKFLGPDSARIEWETERPGPTILEFGRDLASARRFHGGGPRTRHGVTVPGIERETVYSYRVRATLPDGTEMATGPCRLDSTFNYTLSPPPGLPPPFRDERTAFHSSTARKIVDTTGITRGYCLVLGGGEGRLAYHLAGMTELKIVCVEEDAARVTRCRAALERAGLQGTRVTVHHGSLETLSYAPYLANLVVSDTLSVRAAEVLRVTRPHGGTVCLVGRGSAGKPATGLTSRAIREWWSAAPASPGESRFHGTEKGLVWTFRRGPLPGAGEWTHQYGRPDNAASSGDELVHGDLEVLWWGRPGPRPMPDRGPRNPAPLSARGRLYVQGDRILFGMDAYNGTILWSWQIPTLRRANMPRDSSNMVAAGDRLFTAIGSRCVGFDGQTGERELDFRVPELDGPGAHDWGYLAAIGETLIGSATRRGSQYLGDRGEWYDDFRGEEVARVTSDALFTLQLPSGVRKWLHREGVILNSTITVAGGRLFFIESRGQEARKAASGRLFREVLAGQHLVALDLESGQKCWEKARDFSTCEYMTYLCHGRDTLVVTGTDRKKRYHTWGVDARSGESLWEHHAEAKKTHHSGHLGHPVIVGERLFLNQHVLELATGKVLAVEEFDYHGCGIMAASANAIFHRFEFHGMWDLKTNRRTEFQGVRSGCWLGLIPAGGLLLVPESSAGCSCTHALQTSMALVPRAASHPRDSR